MLFCLMHDELVDQTYQGGAINALSQADVSIYDSNFTNNTASGKVSPQLISPSARYHLLQFLAVFMSALQLGSGI